MHVKKLLFIILLSTFLLAAGTRIDAGFHGTGLICSKCHTMHYSENGGILPEWDEGGPFEHLLIMQYSSELCLVCHDKVGYPDTPDVSGQDDNGVIEDRSAGFFGGDDTGPVDPIDYINPNGHNLAAGKVGYSEEGGICTICHGNIWQIGGSSDFSNAAIGCVDCHDPHGRDPGTINYRYRNLVSPWESDPEDTPKITAFVKGGVGGLAVYEQDNIAYSTTGDGAYPEKEYREVTYICLDCHHVFSGEQYTRTDEVCIRHPNTDSVRGAKEPVSVLFDSTDSHWLDNDGIGFDTLDRLPFIVSDASSYGAATVIADAEVFCLTCHKAHGSNNASSLRWNYRHTDPGGASSLGCQQCHNKGSPPSPP